MSRRKIARKNPETGEREVIVRDLTPEEQAAYDARQVQDAIQPAREAAIGRVKSYFVDLVEGIYEDFTMDDLRILQWIHQSTVPAARSDELKTAGRRYVYAKAKISQIRNMTAQQANDYDPVIDPGWPN